MSLHAHSSQHHVLQGYIIYNVLFMMKACAGREISQSASADRKQDEDLSVALINPCFVIVHKKIIHKTYIIVV